MARFLLTAFVSALMLAAPAYAQGLPDDEAAAAARNVFEVPFMQGEEAVAQALNEKGIGDKLSVTILGQRSKALFAYDKPVTVTVKGLQLDKRDNHWSASLLFVADGEVVSAIPATGRYEELIELPVLKREVRNGDIIGAADVEVRDFALSHTRADTVSTISDLIGKTPLHSISPSRPIRNHEIGNPAVVKKNSMVEMRYSSPGMVITASGQAMSDGAKGDVIDVKNLGSKKIVRAAVFDGTTVQIVSSGMEMSQAGGQNTGQNMGQNTGVGHATY